MTQIMLIAEVMSQKGYPARASCIIDAELFWVSHDPLVPIVGNVPSTLLDLSISDEKSRFRYIPVHWPRVATINEKVEQVAQAIDGVWPYQHPLTIDEMRKVACAAIAAMREPTEAMIENGKGAKVSGEVWSTDIPIIYRDMIDAALAPAEARNR